MAEKEEGPAIPKAAGLPAQGTLRVEEKSVLKTQKL